MCGGTPEHRGGRAVVRNREHEIKARILENFYRSMVENFVGSHFGWDDHFVDVIFVRIANRATAKFGDIIDNTPGLAISFLDSLYLIFYAHSIGI